MIGTTGITGAPRIVVVEDFAPLQERLVSRLKTQFPSASFDEVSTEWEFIRRLDDIADCQPTLIVLDMRLRWRNTQDHHAPDPDGSPDEAGFRLLERRKGHAVLRTVPIIATSASMSHHTREAIERQFPDVHIPASDSPESIVGLACSLIAASQSFAPSCNVRIPNRVFISYAREDREWCSQIRVVLHPYCLAGTLQLWDDSKIAPGRWDEQIDQELKTAGIALFLVTTRFWTSPFVQNRELPELLAAYRTEGVKIFWVAVTDSAFEATPLGKFQCTNNPQQPLETFQGADLNRALLTIARAIAASVRLEPS